MNPALPVAIRRATVEDAIAIGACLDTLGYGSDANAIRARLAEFADSTRDAAFVATSGDAADVLGVASAHVLPLFHAPANLLRLTSLAVRADSQGRGIGRALMAAVEAFAWASGCARIEVTSGDQREDAHAFYVTIGYAVNERRFLKHRPA